MDVQLKKIFDKHQEGNLKEAKKSYLELLESEPANSKLNFLIGSLCFQEGNPEEAINYLQKALAINPSDHQSLNNLGLVYQALGNYDYAVNSFHRAISLKDDYINAYNNLSICYHTFDQNRKAIDVLESALLIDPKDPETNFNIGLLCFKEAKFNDAEKYLKIAVELAPQNSIFLYNLAILQIELNHFEFAKSNLVKALKISPNNSEIMFNLGYLSDEEGNFEKAINFYKAAIDVNNNFDEAYFNLGNIYKQQSNWEEAKYNFGKAIFLNENHYKALNNLGYVYHKQCDYEKAIEYYLKSININDEYYDARLNYGASLLEIGQIDSSIEQYELILEKQPDNSEAHFNLAMAMLLQGNYEKGFEEYEHRIKDKIIDERKIWEGEELNGKTILVHDEQGIGDTVQFIRYLYFVKSADTKVIFRCRESLIPLFKNSSLVDQVISFKETVNFEYDYEIQILSLPNVLKITAENIPSFDKYFNVDKERNNYWKERLNNSSKLKIGFAWKGNPKHKYDYKRSMPVRNFEQLLSLNDFEFYSLQLDITESELEFLSQFENVNILGNEIDNLKDTVALVNNLDFVLTVDTAFVHLAGALGKATFLLLSHIPDWRWLLNREDTPWYTSVKLFRQKSIGDWSSVFDEVQTQLANNNYFNDDGVSLKIKAFEAHTEGKLEKAEIIYKELLKDNSDDVELNFWLGKLYFQQSKFSQAVIHLEKSFFIENGNDEYRNALKDCYIFLANNFISSKKFNEAEKVFEKLIQFDISDPDIFNNYGFILQSLQKFDDAETYISKALQIKRSSTYLAALANNFYFQGKFLKAVAYYEEALESDSENTSIRFHKGMLHLLLEDYEKGWNYYSYRSYENEFVAKLNNKLMWDGKSAKDKTLAVFAEQGFGDTIQFSRFLLELKNRFKKVLFFVQPELYNLFSDFSKEIEIYPFNNSSVANAEYDAYLPLLEFPRLLKIKTETIPADTPYLQPATNLINKWKNIVKSETKLKVGLVWRGNKKNVLNNRRFLELNDVIPLLNNTAADYFVMQYGLTDDEKQILSGFDNVKILGDNSFEDWAAITSLLDLVITPDTYSAHLAGALDVNAFLLLNEPADWKWLLNRSDTPWYSTLKLFRKKISQSWQDCIEEVNAELSQLINNYNSKNNLSDSIEFARKFIDKNEIDKAIEELNKILVNNPESADALFYLGYCYHLKNDLFSAYENYSKVISLDPSHYNAYNNLGMILKDYQRLNEAEKCFNISLKINKDNAMALNNLGIVFDLKGEFEKAIEAFLKAIELNGNYSEAHLNIANSYQAINNKTKALESINQAIKINSLYADAHFNKSLILMKYGNLKEGLIEYEWRKRKSDYPKRKFSKPELFDHNVKNKTVFVYDEQGFGDTLQFVRYLYMLKKLGANIIFECHKSLYDLVKNIEAIDGVSERVNNEEPDIHYDYHVSLISLPLYFGTTLESIPNSTPYLSSNKKTKEFWRDFLSDEKRLKVGLVWEGKKPLYNSHRASSLIDFAELTKIEDAKYYSLQVGDAAQRNKELLSKHDIADLSTHISNFNTTAAIIENLDLVISVDTSVAHLSGALNKPTWTMLSYKADWRWFAEGEDCIWYPSMKLYRQKEFGNWIDVIQKISNDLKDLITNNYKPQYKELNYGL